MRTILRALTMIAIAAGFLALVLLASGCSALKPDAYTGAFVHQSVPFKGPGPAPFGDDERSIESNIDGLQLGVEWEEGRLFWDANVIYATSATNVEGGPWHTQFRVGVRIRPR